MTLPFFRSSYPAGKEFAQRAQRLRATVEGEAEDGAKKMIELRGAPVGLWRVTSVQHKEGTRTWYVLATQLVGRIGDRDWRDGPDDGPIGPMLDDWRLAMSLRDAFKKGEPWPPEPPEPPAIEAQPEPPKPAIAGEPARPKPIVVTSGRQAYEQPPRDEAPPPIDAPDGPELDDEIIVF